MDYNSRKAGMGSTLLSSKESPISMSADPLKGGRLTATALGRPSKEHVQSSGDHGVKRSHDHVKSSTSKEPQKISKDYVKLKDDTGRKPVTIPQLQPKSNIADRNSSIEDVVRSQETSEKVLHRLKDDREREILNQSLKRTKVTGGDDPKLQHRVLKDDREREILNQSLKRTKVIGGEDHKVPQRVKDRERDIPNQSLKRTQVRDQEDLKTVQRLKSDSREKDTLNQSVRKAQFTGADASKLRLEKPREPLKSKSETRPDATKASTGHGTEKAVRKDTLSTKALPEVKLEKDNTERTKSVMRPTVTNTSTRVEDDVKKERLSSDKKRTMGLVKAEDGKDVRVQRSITKIEPVVATSHSTSKNGGNVSKEPLRSVKMVTGTVVKAKQEKLKKKVFSLPGQRFEPPEERDALRLFYGSLHQQIPTSDMANIWLMEHGLLEADEAQKVLTHKVKPKSGSVSKASPYQATTPSRLSNGSARKTSKFRNEDFLDIKPVSKKLKL